MDKITNHISNTLFRYQTSILICLLTFNTFISNGNDLSKNEITAKVIILTTTAEKNQVVFNKNKPLTFSDFQGRPKTQELNTVAGLHSGISIMISSQEINGKTQEITISLTPYMDQKKSWMKDKGRNETVLLHEQIHFDITAIHTCSLASQLKQKKFNPASFKKEVEGLYQQTLRELEIMQRKYDLETQHGTYSEKQAEWVERIKTHRMLQECY